MGATYSVAPKPPRTMQTHPEPPPTTSPHPPLTTTLGPHLPTRQPPTPQITAVLTMFLLLGEICKQYPRLQMVTRLPRLQPLLPLRQRRNFQGMQQMRQRHIVGNQRRRRGVVMMVGQGTWKERPVLEEMNKNGRLVSMTMIL